jgi:hypothetical protein
MYQRVANYLNLARVDHIEVLVTGLLDLRRS